MTEITASPVPTHLLADAATAELEDWGRLDEATGPRMDQRGCALWKGEGGAEAGVWECTPGPSRWVQDENEFAYIISGSVTVTPDGGEPARLGPGGSLFVPKGWTGTWDIHETLRKVYVVF